MKLVLASDHYGYPLKVWLLGWLVAQGHEVVDAGGAAGADSHLLDYVDVACKAVARGKAERGVLVCMSGGMAAIRANRYPALRCVTGWDARVVAHDREASDVNMLALAGYDMSLRQAEDVVAAFLATPFEPLPRRLARLAALAGPTDV